MMTDNENWRNGSDENQESANGYNRSFNRENRFNSYNNYNRSEADSSAIKNMLKRIAGQHTGGGV